MEELSTVAKKSVHGQVYRLQKPDYTRDVTEASKGSFVLVHLTSSSSGNVESRLLTELWRELARVFGDVKFCEIQGDMCIEGYPEKNCPTILVYHGGEIVKQLLTLKDLNGQRTTQGGECNFYIVKRVFVQLLSSGVRLMLTCLAFRLSETTCGRGCS